MHALLTASDNITTTEIRNTKKKIHVTMKTLDRAKTQNSKLKQDTKHSTSFKK